MAYDNTNKGTLGKNTRKTEDKHPDLSGSLNVNGHDFWLSGWKQTNKSDGSVFYSLSVKPKDGQPQQQEQRRGPSRDSDRDPF